MNTSVDIAFYCLRFVCWFCFNNTGRPKQTRTDSEKVKRGCLCYKERTSRWASSWEQEIGNAAKFPRVIQSNLFRLYPLRMPWKRKRLKKKKVSFKRLCNFWPIKTQNLLRFKFKCVNTRCILYSFALCYFFPRWNTIRVFKKLCPLFLCIFRPQLAPIPHNCELSFTKFKSLNMFYVALENVTEWVEYDFRTSWSRIWFLL